MGRRRHRGGPYRVGDDEDGEPGVITAHAAAIGARLARLERDYRIRTVALVADTFKLDPVALLEEPDELKRLIRLAAHNVVQTETEKAQKRS